MALGADLGNMFGGIDEQNAANDEAERLRKMQIAPQFYGGDYQSPEYTGDYNPLLYSDPEAAQYQTVNEDPRLRGVQMDALQHLIDQGNGAADAGANAARFGALDDANQLAKSREDAIRMDAERKGQGGAGMDMVMRQNAAQQSANRAKSGTLDAVHQAALEKLAATGQAMSGAAGVRGQDFNAAKSNADIINQFGMFNTNARNEARRANTQLQNDAGMRNLNARQSSNNTRASTGNASIDRRDKLAGAAHDAQMDRFAMENAISAQGRKGTGQAIAGAAGAAGDLAQAAPAGMGGGYGGMKSVAKQSAAPDQDPDRIKDPYNEDPYA